MDFNLVYTLSDPLLIEKVGTVNEPEWDITLDLTEDDVKNLIKAKNALTDIDNLIIQSAKNLDQENVLEFIFGDESDYNNKVIYQVKCDILNNITKIPFNSNVLKDILSSNKENESGKLYVSGKGLIKLVFSTEDLQSKYFMVRKTDTSF